MIPILYNQYETEFKSNGVGRLADAISCVITEVKNGEYELQLTYPVKGIRFGQLVPGAYIKAQNGRLDNMQIFTIYKVSKPLNGIVTVDAEHMSYGLSKIIVSPFSAQNISMAFTGFTENASTNCPFIFWTDKVTDGDFNFDVPSSIRSKLGGSEGSILDVYGGTYEFDNFTVRLWDKRGKNKGVSLRYGKNITDIKQEENIRNTITGVHPYWKKNETYYELSQKVVLSENASSFPKPLIAPLDCSGEFETQPTERELIDYANDYLKKINAGIPDVSIAVSFVDLSKTEEYKNIAMLEEVMLCDEVCVYFEKLNISATAEVVKTKYNVLREQYDSIEVGSVKGTLSSNIAQQNKMIKEKPSRSFLENAIHNATKLITGADGGFVVLHLDGNGKPYELLIMDAENIETAKNVWRYNKNGWGHSSSGYNGPYTLAATLDGGFVADFITAGTMLANRIKGGTLTLGGVNNGNGVASILDSEGTEVVRMSQDGLVSSKATITGGDIHIKSNTTSQTALRVSYGGYNAYVYAGSIDIYGPTGAILLDSDGQITVNANGQTGGSVLNLNSANCIIGEYTKVKGDFYVTGTKSRLTKTVSYNDRLLYCYEMPSPMFGDTGHGVIGEDGLCYIDIDPIFFETIDTNQSYQVFLQSYTECEVHVKEKQEGYFIVKGQPDTEFDWEIKAKQMDFPLERLEEQFAEDDYEETDYIASASIYLNEYEKEVLSYG